MAAVPAGHAAHDDDPDDDTLPGPHAVAAVDPAAHSDPLGHTMHADALAAPAAGWNVPPGHASHVALVVAPVRFDHVPAGHRTHCSALVMPVASLCVPAGQAAHRMRNSPNRPAAHATQSNDEPDPAALSVPAGHCSQMALPAAAN